MALVFEGLFGGEGGGRWSRLAGSRFARLGKVSDFNQSIPFVAGGALARPLREFVAATITHKEGRGSGHILSIHEPHIKVIHKRHNFSFLLVFGLKNNTEITTGRFIFQGIYVYRLKNLTRNDIVRADENPDQSSLSKQGESDKAE